MNSRYSNRLRRRLSILATVTALAWVAGAAGSAVAAQYQWRDAKGQMVYSDLPPPSSIPPDRIIQGPSILPVEPVQAESTPDSNATKVATAGSSNAGTAVPGSGAAGLTLADRDMAGRKQAAELAAVEKKAAEEAGQKNQLARACGDAQANIRMLESGQRISRVNATGEREFLSDNERMQRLTEARKNVSERC